MVADSLPAVAHGDGLVGLGYGHHRGRGAHGGHDHAAGGRGAYRHQPHQPHQPHHYGAGQYVHGLSSTVSRVGYLDRDAPPGALVASSHLAGPRPTLRLQAAAARGDYGYGTGASHSGPHLYRTTKAVAHGAKGRAALGAPRRSPSPQQAWGGARVPSPPKTALIDRFGTHRGGDFQMSYPQPPSTASRVYGGGGPHGHRAPPGHWGQGARGGAQGGSPPQGSRGGAFGLSTVVGTRTRKAKGPAGKKGTPPVGGEQAGVYLQYTSRGVGAESPTRGSPTRGLPGKVAPGPTGRVSQIYGSAVGVGVNVSGNAFGGAQAKVPAAEPRGDPLRQTMPARLMGEEPGSAGGRDPPAAGAGHGDPGALPATPRRAPSWDDSKRKRKMEEKERRAAEALAAVARLTIEGHNLAAQTAESWHDEASSRASPTKGLAEGPATSQATAAPATPARRPSQEWATVVTPPPARHNPHHVPAREGSARPASPAPHMHSVSRGPGHPGGSGSPGDSEALSEVNSDDLETLNPESGDVRAHPDSPGHSKGANDHVRHRKDGYTGASGTPQRATADTAPHSPAARGSGAAAGTPETPTTRSPPQKHWKRLTMAELKERYLVMGMVGQGAYGLVMKCREVASGQLVAIKEFKVDDGDPDAMEVRRTAKREVTLMRELQHPNVVVHLDDFFIGQKLFIVMRFVPRNVLELLESSPGNKLPRAQVRSILYQLCKAIEFMHESGVVYRDVKPENMLVDDDGNMRLCDFGFSRRIEVGGEPCGGHSRCSDPRLTDYVATRWYRAPELLLGPPYKRQGRQWRPCYGFAVDVWAVGCLMGELVDGDPVFPGDSDVDQLDRIQRLVGPALPEHIAQWRANPAHKSARLARAASAPFRGLQRRYEAKLDAHELDFLCGCLNPDPVKRLTAKQCLAHPYFGPERARELEAGG